MRSRSGFCWAEKIEIDGSGGARDLINGSLDVLWLDPDVPIVHVCQELGTAVEHTVSLREDQS